MAESDSKKTSKVGSYTEFGIACLAVAVVLFVLMTVKESSGGSTRMPWIIAMLYSFGGKWVVSGALALGGLGCFIAAAVKNSQEDKTPTAQPH